MGTSTALNPDSMVYDPTTGTYSPFSKTGTGMDYVTGSVDYAAAAIANAQAQDYINSLLETDPSLDSPTVFTADDYLKGIDASDGISTDETDLAFTLLNTGAVTVADIEAKTGIPASAIQSTYDTIAAANASQVAADLAAEIAAADAEERRVTGSLNEFGETYDEEQFRLASERSAANDAIMQQNAAALAAEAAEREAATQGAADSPEAAATQVKDDDFDTKVNAAGGVTPGTIDKVIDIALEVYGDNSRGVVKVISESLKGGLTMKDLEEATDLSGEEIMAAAKTAANDPNKSLTPGEILSGAANTVYDTTNKIVTIVETGLEVTGIEKVIDIIGNTVSKVIGLDGDDTKKVLVVNPTTGQVTVQASNQPNGGVLGSLPQSPYVPIGTTSGGTTYGVDAENAIINTVLGKIITTGGLDQDDTKSIIGASVEQIFDIPTEVTVKVINDAEDLAKGAVKVIKDSGVLGGSGNRQDDEEAATTGFDVITGGTDDTTITAGPGNDTLTGGPGNDTSVSATDGLMGPFQLDEDGNTIVDTGQSNTTLTLAPTITAATPCDTAGEVRNPETLVCAPPTGAGEDIPCPTPGDVRNKNGDCYTPGPTGRTKIDEDLTVADITATTPCDIEGEVRDPETLVCAPPTDLTVADITAATPCDTAGEVRNPETLVCAPPTDLTVADITATTPCDIEGEVRDPTTLVCAKPTDTTTTTTTTTTGTGKIICPDTYNNAKAEVDSLDQCGGLKSTSTVVKKDDDKTVVIDGVTNVVNYVCKEEGAVYNPVTERCEKTNTTTLDTTVKEEVVCSDPDAVYDATLNNGEGGCFKTTTRTIDGANTLTQTVCETGTWDGTLQKCVNTVNGDVITQTVCKDGSAPDADGNCIVTIKLDSTNTTVCSDGKPVDPVTGCDRITTVTGDVITNFSCPEGSYEIEGVCYNDVTGEVVENTVCPAGQTLNTATGQCEYTKVLCGAGFTLNILTGQCEPDESEEVEGATRPIVPPASLNLAGRGDFVDRDDVLVENTGDVGGIYSILPAPVRESFLADRRKQDIRNVADTVGIQQGGGLEQDQAAVDRFAGYANAFDVGLPELLDISGVTPGDVPAYEDKFNVQFPVTGIAPPVAPTNSISDVRYDPTSYVPTAMARGGVVESESGIESLLDRRQNAVNRMLSKRAGSYFGQ